MVCLRVNVCTHHVVHTCVHMCGNKLVKHPLYGYILTCKLITRNLNMIKHDY